MTRIRSGLRFRILLRTLDRLSPAARGIVAMLGAMAAFACGDALMKVSADRLPLGEALCLRGVIAAVLIWLLAARTGALRSLPRRIDWRLGARTLGDAGASFFYVAALGWMPLADAAAIGQTSPLAVTASAALFLGERVGWRRWTATAIGFAGVLLIIQPGSSAFAWASLLVVMAVVSTTFRDIVTRRLVGIPAVLITATAVSVTTLMSLGLLTVETWHMPTSSDAVRAATAALCLLAGQILVVVSIQSGEVSAVVPFRYSHILWTLLLSLVIWRYLPNALTLTGIVIVCGAGLYTFFREQTLRRVGQPR